MDPKTVEMILVIGFLILSLGIHEAAHAWVAFRCGDTTARDLGRLTLNPIAHIDFFFTILLPAFLYITSGFVFGGAKPVPVVSQRLRHPTRDMMFVALAGPISNILLAVVFALVWKTLIYVANMNPNELAPRVMLQSVMFNIVLAIFNMIPVPPLDGSRVMAYFLPRGLRESYVALERVGMLIVLGLFFTGVFERIIYATFDPVWDFIAGPLTGGTW